jgi:hypothetical protein
MTLRRLWGVIASCNQFRAKFTDMPPPSNALCRHPSSAPKACSRNRSCSKPRFAGVCFLDLVIRDPTTQQGIAAFAFHVPILSPYGKGKRNRH